MFHLAAWFQSIDPANAFTNLNAVQDQVVTTQGIDVRVPLDLQNIVGQAALINDASGSRAQFQSPSLRAMMNLDAEPIVLAAVFGSPPESMIHGDCPIPVIGNESLNFGVLSDPAAAAAHYGLLWLADGALQPVKGPIYTVRCTATIQQVAGLWVNGNLTFTQALPAGKYQVVGMRVRSADAVAARLVFVGGKYRPGIPVVNAIADLDPYFSRYGQMGVWGEFDNTTPPTMDILGGVAAAQTVLLDLVKTR